MLYLLNWRLWALGAILAALAGSHFTAYRSGGASARASLQAYQLEQASAAAAASEAARVKETQLNLSVERLRANYAKVKKDNAALTSSLDDSLQQFKTALGDRSLKNPAATPGANGTGGLERDILGSCATSLAELAITADRLETKVVGLQGYVRNVCTAP